MRRWIGLSGIAVLGLVGCGDDSSCPTCPQPSFAFRITVRDAAGDRVPGLQTSLLYPPLPGFPDFATQSAPQLPATSVRFDAPDSALVTFDILDFEHRSVAQPLTSYPVMAGSFQIAVAPDVPYSVYWMRLVARQGEAIVFRDSVLAAWWPIGASTNVLGSTDADGVLQTTDALRFPNVLDLPPLVGMNANGDSVGTFSYPDTVSLVLSEPPGGPVQRLSVYRVVVGPGTNDFELTWPNTGMANGGTTGAGTREAAVPAAVTQTVQSGKESLARRPGRSLVLEEPPVALPPAAWRLYQNAPNPVY